MTAIYCRWFLNGSAGIQEEPACWLFQPGSDGIQEELVSCFFLALMVSRKNLLVVSTWLWWYPGGTCWLLLPGSVGIQEGAEWNLVDEYVDESIRRLPQLQDKNTTLTHLNVHLFSLYNRDPDLHWLITASGTWNVLVVIRSDPIPYYLAFITKITIQNIFF